MAEELPVILVSAADTASANAVITDLINDELTNDSGGEGSPERVWVVDNKYYRARVRLVAVGDCASPPAPPSRLQAHIVHLGATELRADTLSRRAATAQSAAPHVRLALCALPDPAAPLPAPLDAAARALRYELVPLTPVASPAPASAPAGPFPELSGLARVREALHAHSWPGLRLHGEAARAGDDTVTWRDDSAEDDDTSDGGEESDEPTEEECVRRAELFAEALGALGAARDLRTAEGDSGDPERLVRAEQLLHAFAAALGTDVDRL